MASKLLQNLRHQGARDAVLLGDFAGATRVLFTGVQSQMFDRNQAVVGFFRKLEHSTFAEARRSALLGDMRLIRSGLSVRDSAGKVNLRFTRSAAIKAPYFNGLRVSQ